MQQNPVFAHTPIDQNTCPRSVFPLRLGCRKRKYLNIQLLMTQGEESKRETLGNAAIHQCLCAQKLRKYENC